MDGKTYYVTVHETRARTYQIKANNEDDAIQKYKTVPYQEMVEDQCIDEDITGVVQKCGYEEWQLAGEPEHREDGTPYYKWDEDIQCTCD